MSVDEGHHYISGSIDRMPFHIDSWGRGPFYIRVGKKRYCFEFSQMFGPLLLGKNGAVLENQPVSERHPFWLGFCMWLNGGKKVRWGGRVCVYEKATPGSYYISPETGLKTFISDPPNGLEYLGYREIQDPRQKG